MSQPQRRAGISIVSAAIVGTFCFCCIWNRPPERDSAFELAPLGANPPALLATSPPFDAVDDNGWTGVSWKSVNKQHVSGSAYNSSALFVWCHDGGPLQLAVRANPIGRNDIVWFGVQSTAQPTIVEGRLDRATWLWHHPPTA